MPTIDPRDLELLIEDSDIDQRSAEKMRQANEPESPQPRRHGAPSQDTRPLTEI